MSVSVPGSFEIFQNTWLCEFVFNYDIFIQPGTPSNLSKCQMYNNNENWSYFVSDILIYLGKSLKIISHFPRNLGVQKRSIFRSRGVPGRLEALLAKSLILPTLDLHFEIYFSGSSDKNKAGYCRILPTLDLSLWDKLRILLWVNTMKFDPNGWNLIFFTVFMSLVILLLSPSITILIHTIPHGRLEHLRFRYDKTEQRLR